MISARAALAFAACFGRGHLAERLTTLRRASVPIVGIRDGPEIDDLSRAGPMVDTPEAGNDWLLERGVGSGLALMIPAACRPADVLAGLDRAIAQRRRHRVPSIDFDPAWVIAESGWDRRRAGVREALFAVTAGGIGTRGVLEELTEVGPVVLAAGVYEGRGAAQRLLAGPDWTRVELRPPPASEARWLDLRSGVLLRVELAGDGPPLRSARFASARRPGVVAMRVEGGAGRITSAGPLTGRAGEPAASRMAVRGSSGTVLAAAAADSDAVAGGVRVLDRLGALAAGENSAAARRSAAGRLRRAGQAGFDRLLAEQRATWAQRWRDVDVRLPGAPRDQLGIRFALFHLWSHAAHTKELAIGARGVTGGGYAGHVFWDADVYVLPALMTMDPDAARAMLRYRYNRLPAAREYARASGRRGARFPWESADDGTDVTPRSGEFAGRTLPILTGLQEEHITADVAWAASFCAEWDGRAPSRAERVLIVEAARYWASRCRPDPGGRAHIDGVIGPDEYHEAVDDNAYTNVMARWTLRRAAALGTGVRAAEALAWRALADSLADGYDPATGLYEQFTGYFELADLTMRDVAPPPVAADLLLGAERVASSQLIKQLDVLMLHHLVPEETQPGSLAANLDYYLPRTAHGSSLSPAIAAAVLARAGRADAALELLRIALRLDLDDLTGTTAGGLHLATLGGVWQCLVLGFAGARVRDRCLHLDPTLPAAWPRMELRFRALGRAVRLSIDAQTVRVVADAPLPVRVGPLRRTVPPGPGVIFLRGGG